MSCTIGRLTLLCLTLLAGLVLVAPVAGQAPRNQKRDALDDFRRRQEVAGQKVELDIRVALRAAQQLAQKEPDKAVERLEKCLAQLEDDTTLPEKRREALKRILKDRIRVIKADGDKSSKDAAEKTEKEIRADIRRILESQRTKAQKEIAGTLDRINTLKKEGKADEADRLAADLARRHPDSPAVQASKRISATNDQLNNSRSDRNQRVNDALRGVAESAVPPSGDIQFPKDWKERTKNRKSQLVRLTPKERAILQSLNSTITVNFKDSRFEDVIEYIATFTGQPIILDKNDLADAQVTYETPVSARVRGVTVRSLLRKVLNELGLTYVIKDEVIQVVSIERAKTMLVTRVYPISDLLAGMGMLNDIRLSGPGVNELQVMQNVTQFIDLIQSTVDPDCWNKNGGNGSIVFHGPSLSLIIRSTAEVHGVLGSGVGK